MLAVSLARTHGAGACLYALAALGLSSDLSNIGQEAPDRDILFFCVDSPLESWEVKVRPCRHMESQELLLPTVLLRL
jgi:hypothetical protein